MTIDSTLAVAAQRRSTKRVFLTTTSAAAVLVAGALAGFDPANAQTAQGQTAQSQTAQAPVEEIVVTGSLIVRNGYQAPTPVTVLSTKDIEDIGAINFIDAAVKMPALGSGTNSHTSGDSNSDGNAGTNSLSLRELGAYRTLVLLDGVRVTPNNPIGNVSNGGSVDINSLPDGLIQRMDVVTGGATATYGSGALAGVVNLILDKDFTGLKGTVEGGVTTYGDDRQYAITLTGGTAFADGRGHFLIDLEDRYTDGVPDAQQARPWIANDWGQVTNPAYTATNGQPFYLLVPQAGAANYAPGGVITSGPLKGTAFTPTGSPIPFIYGSPTDGTVMSGGNFTAASGALNGNFGTDGSLDVHLVRQNVFTRASYDVSDNVNLYAQWGYSTSDVDANGRVNYASVTIASGNPFIPTAIQQQMTADKLSSIALGLYLTPLGQLGSYASRIFNMYLAGGQGKFDAFGSNWSWNVFATQSSSITSDTAHNVYQKTNLTTVVNAVTGPNGTPICASSVANPGNGCVPFDPFGTNNASQAAINGLIGIYDHEHLDEWLDEIAATVKGEPFSTWAGPVSLALGLEWDKNASKSTADPIALAGGYSTGNFGQVNGHYETKEGFGEVVIPLAKDQSWAKALDLNAGLRITDFSNTGEVTTWKVGATYSPIDDIRFRVTQSRDTRSPNLGELFSTGKAITGNINNPWQGNAITTGVLEDTVGNPSVHPETADTTGIGVVVQPSWLHNFSASFDYYHISIQNSLTSLAVQSAINDCYQYGTFCNLVVQDASHNISEVYIQPVNALGGAGQKGFDLEASYTQQLADMVQSWEGSLNVRLLATHLLDQFSTGSDGTVTPGNFPSWRYTLTVDYDADRFSVNWTGRGVNGYKINPSWITCTSSCPTSVPPYYTVNENWIPHQFYMDMAFTYHLKPEGYNADVFFNVEDLTNGHPPAISFLGNTLDFGNPLGRIFRAGVRFKM